MVGIGSRFFLPKGGGSDHNWVFLVVEDKFVKERRILNIQNRKPRWKIRDEMDWIPFQECVRSKLFGKETEGLSVDELASLVSGTLLAAGRETIGLRDPAERKKPKLYPRGIVEEIELKRELERRPERRLERRLKRRLELRESLGEFLREFMRV